MGERLSCIRRGEENQRLTVGAIGDGVEGKYSGVHTDVG